MNELREKIDEAIMLELTRGHKVDAILDAVISALPEIKPVPAYKDAVKWSQGYREAVLETKAILQAAKESK